MDVNTLKSVVESFNIPIKDLSINALDKPTKEIGEGLGNLFWLVFSPIHAARAAIEPRIQGFKNDIEREVAKIPQDQLVESPLNIIGPALESSKFHIEHEEIRLLFAKLIASSMDSMEQEKVHPAFVEVIKQLSPFDVKILEMLVDNPIWPVGQIVIKVQETSNHSRGQVVFAKDFFPFPMIDMSNYQQYSTALDNLSRLSLISFDYMSRLAEETRYEVLVNHKLYEQAVHFCESNKQSNEFPSVNHTYESVELVKGAWEITDFGKAFTACCF